MHLSNASNVSTHCTTCPGTNGYRVLQKSFSMESNHDRVAEDDSQGTRLNTPPIVYPTNKATSDVEVSCTIPDTPMYSTPDTQQVVHSLTTICSSIPTTQPL
jgi:hypothetical protein